MELSKYLYGNSKTKISWPLFIEFIRNEEEEYRLKNYKEENKVIKKSKISNQIIHNKFIKDIQNSKIDKDNILRIFLNWHENSCRYDSFLFLFCFIVIPYIKNNNIIILDKKLELIYNIGLDILNLNKEELIKGIWPILNKYSNEVINFTNKNMKFKLLDSIVQPISFLKNNSLFCIKYETLEGCSNCTLPILKENFYNPFIEINLNDLLSSKSLNSILNEKFLNISSYCKRCNYNEKGEDINKNIKSNYIITKKKILPNFIFLLFEFAAQTDENILNLNNQNEMEFIFNKIVLNNNLIKNFIDIQKNINEIIYNLVGIINTPTFDHFTAMILNLPFDFEGLKKLSSYYYDYLGGNDNFKKIYDLNECIKINYLLCLLYMRDNQN